jgi:hypothetical protein
MSTKDAPSERHTSYHSPDSIYITNAKKLRALKVRSTDRLGLCLHIRVQSMYKLILVRKYGSLHIGGFITHNNSEYLCFKSRFSTLDFRHSCTSDPQLRRRIL